MPNDNKISRNVIDRNGEGNGNPLQYFCLETPMGRGAWQTIVHEIGKGWI